MNNIQKSALLEIKDRKVLVARSHGKDKFYMPGGKIEAGETAEDALIREMKEEIGVRIIPTTVKIFGIYTAEAHGKPEGTLLDMYLFTAEYSGIPEASSEIQEIRYFDFSQKADVGGVAQVIFDDLKAKNMID